MWSFVRFPDSRRLACRFWQWPHRNPALRSHPAVATLRGLCFAIPQGILTLLIRLIPLLAGTMLVTAGPDLAAQNLSSDETAVTPLDVIIQGLDSAEFQERLVARENLRSISSSQIPQLTEIVNSQSSAESGLVIVEVLADLYVSDNTDVARAASEVLESLANSRRVSIQEAAAHVLDTHWRQRADLAADILRQHGALIILPYGQPKLGEVEANHRNGFPRQGNRPDDTIRVIITEDWKGGSEELLLVSRLPGIKPLTIPPAPVDARMRFLGGTGKPLVSVYLISGHPLSDEDAGLLRRVAGDARVSERGPVMLGISSPAGTAGSGCYISDTTENAAAAHAGLLAGDRITQLNDTPIRSFEDLVDDLKKYKVGETVTVLVIRRLQEIAVPVELTGWKDYAERENAAH